MTSLAYREQTDPRRAMPPGRHAFRLCWAGHTATQLAEWILLVALIAQVYGRDTGVSSVALLLLARLLPRALLLPIAPAVAGWPARVLPLLDLSRAALAVLLLWSMPGGALWASLAIVFAGQVSAALAGELRGQLLPLVVARRELAAASWRLGLTGQLAFVAGPTAGGLLAWWDSRVALAVSAGLFLVAAPLAGVASGQLARRQPRALADTADGIRLGLAVVVRDSGPLQIACAGCALGMGIVTGLLVGFPALFAGRFGLPPGLIGPALGLVGVGALLASVPIIRLVSRFPLAPLLAAMLVVLTCGKAVVLASGWLPLTLLALVAIGGAAMINELAATITVRRLAPAPAVEAVQRSLLWVGTLGQIAGVLGGGLAGHFLTRTSALGLAVVLEVAALALLLLRWWPTRQVSPAVGISASLGR